MRGRIALALTLTGLGSCAIGCKQQVDRVALKSAINRSYAGKHICIWPEAVKLPVQVDPSKDERIRDLNALYDAGLLIRAQAEKNKFLADAKELDKFDLSDKGHSAWTPEDGKPGYGNFCFGHFNVTAIDKAAPNASSNPTQYVVTYRYEVEGIPDWARTPESMRSFRNIVADTSIQSATTTVVKGADGTWAVAPGQTAH